jgi:hypothetical protein
MPALYIDSLEHFLDVNPEQLLGRLTAGLAREGFDTTTLSTFSWQHEIVELQTAFRQLLDLLPLATCWSILLEYVLPIVGQRVDCVLLSDDMIYVIEYKSGTTVSAHAALRQAQDYALNLLDFHEASRGRTAVPIATGSFKTFLPLDIASEHQGAAVPLVDLAKTIVQGHEVWSGKITPFDPNDWNNSRYFPVPTIVQAASAIYDDHNVKDLAHSRAGTENLETTQRPWPNWCGTPGYMAPRS